MVSGINRWVPYVLKKTFCNNQCSVRTSDYKFSDEAQHISNISYFEALLEIWCHCMDLVQTERRYFLVVTFDDSKIINFYL